MSVVVSCSYRNLKRLFYGKKAYIQNITRNNSENATAPASYCIDLVRKYDYENFLCTCLLPNQIQPLAFAIRAFNVEISRVQDNVSQLHTGQMRLAFWSETVDRIFKEDVRKHPVIIELHRIPVSATYIAIFSLKQ